MKKLLRLAAGATVSLSLLGAGVASAATGTIGTTGPESTNKVSSETSTHVSVENNNHVKGENNNPQHASTGDVRVHENTTAGGAQSGAASNNSTLNATLTVDNSSAQANSGDPSAPSNSGTITNTGPESTNKVSSETNTRVTVENNNHLSFENNNRQSASSGDVSQSENTTAGSAMSGDASNTSNTTVNFSVTN